MYIFNVLFLNLPFLFLLQMMMNPPIHPSHHPSHTSINDLAHHTVISEYTVDYYQLVVKA